MTTITANNLSSDYVVRRYIGYRYGDDLNTRSRLNVCWKASFQFGPMRSGVVQRRLWYFLSCLTWFVVILLSCWSTIVVDTLPRLQISSQAFFCTFIWKASLVGHYSYTPFAQKLTNAHLDAPSPVPTIAPCYLTIPSPKLFVVFLFALAMELSEYKQLSCPSCIHAQLVISCDHLDTLERGLSLWGDSNVEVIPVTLISFVFI